MSASAPAPVVYPAGDGRLRWDGRQWWLERGDAVQPGRPEVVWDFDLALVVRWHGEGRRWLWLARRHHGPGWHALRVALMHAVTTHDHPT
ncbi:MAG: hypothetical protein LCH73_16855 [Proteobacteria bacterium]|nr:hypothetical protein [Pseudomonadota bacterium]